MKTGQKYYLQLYAPGRDENFLFDQWLRLIYLMHITRGRIRKPASESGHPMLQKSSSMLGLTKKPWLPAIMEQGSTGHLKEQLCQVHSSRETQSSIESDIASKHSLLKSDMAAFSSVSQFGISGSKNKSGGRASKRQPLCTDPKVAKRSKAKKLVASQAGSPIFYRPELRKQTIPKQTSPCSVGVRSLEFATMPQGTGLSQPRAMSLPVGPSKVPQQIKAVESCPTKNVRKHSVTKPEEILPVPMTSSKAKYVPIKLQKSKKSEALARSPKTREKGYCKIPGDKSCSTKVTKASNTRQTRWCFPNVISEAK
ncbi:hypothetical protein JRQ81_005877 [Phrynocephalus forsythii]|uniref:Protein FAM71E2 n=1 Tax=Phrynocephalus forsythii TaxID=171643 RepID=A0A9Q1AW33_9SAUR|nr:hypothetical protein JRQ81_005877 [Phrynocephalus forsythii]